MNEGRPRSTGLVLVLVLVVLGLAALVVWAPRTVRAPVEPPRVESTTDGDTTLAFHIREGGTDNHFYRRGPVTAHVLVTGGERPRLLFAFPAGNSGAVLWFEAPSGTVLRLDGELDGVERDQSRGVTGVFVAEAPALTESRVLLGTIRAIRDAALDAPVPEAIAAHEVVRGPPVEWRRSSLDGVHRYALIIDPLDGTLAEAGQDGRLQLVAGANGTVRFRATALTSEPPLTPIPLAALIRAQAADDERQRNALAFLTYDEKMLAGSWRFLTYFGRDTLLSVRLLMPALQPRAVEAALGSVLDRLSADGQVAHEEDIGEQAALRNRALSAPPADLSTPIYDYKMVDDDYLLAPVVAQYLLDTPDGRDRAQAFLAREAPDGRRYADAIRANLDFVIAGARPYADAPRPGTLVALHEREPVGEWRDSNEGLGRGRIPFNVNAALVPAALEAALRLLESPLFEDSPDAVVEVRRLQDAWRSARRHFDVEIPRSEAARRVHVYADEIGVPADEAIAALPDRVVFPAIALDGRGRPIPVRHSDDGFVLLFGTPPAAELAAIAARLRLPFPAGLRTPVGLVVANPAYATERPLRDLFTRAHYHGTVVWSWQQAMMAAGLARQLARTELPPDVRTALVEAEHDLWDVIEAERSLRTSELWTWGYDASTGYRAVPFGAEGGHRDESNAAQLWSTVYLAVRRPPR